MIALKISVFILGLVFGSFLNVLIYRLPRKESIVRPGSYCTSCGTALTPVDLVPVLSFIFLKAKCRHCGVRINTRYPFVELLAGGIFLLLFEKYGATIEFAGCCFLSAILLAVFFIDLEHQIIPDSLVVWAILGGMLMFAYNFFHPVQLYGDREWWNPLVGAVSGSGILLAVALLGTVIYKSGEVMGMGDVKVFIPIGLFLGWRMTLLALVLAVFSSGITSLFLVAGKIKQRKDTIPFGPFIAAAAFLTVIAGWNILNWYAGLI